MEKEPKKFEDIQWGKNKLDVKEYISRAELHLILIRIKKFPHNVK